jgi:nucleotide-binding universal stress UspA family protein
MSSHGYGGLRRWVYGSVAHKVVSSSQIPVLVVRPDKEE